MGEIADMMLDGTLCQVCGCAMEDVGPDFEPPGHPRTCGDCKPKRRKRRGKRGGKKHRKTEGGAQ